MEPLPDSRPDLSVIVATMNNRRLLTGCLESLRALPDAITWELVLVDNGSSDGSAELTETLVPGARLIRNPSNTGFAHANNQGMAVAQGRYLMLLNDDTVVRPFALQRLVAFMDEHPEVGACGPKLWYPDGRYQPSCFSFESPWRYLCEMLHLASFFPRSRRFSDQSRWFDHESTAPADWVMGAAILVRGEVIGKVGTLDERFRVHCNEVDWCYRIRQAGWLTYFVHDAEIVHHCGATVRRSGNPLAFQGEICQNMLDYYTKHFGRAGVAWFRFWTVVGYSVRAARYAVLNLLNPTDRTRSLGRLCQGMVRVGLTGKPGQFTTAPARIG